MDRARRRKAAVRRRITMRERRPSWRWAGMAELRQGAERAREAEAMLQRAAADRRAATGPLATVERSAAMHRVRAADLARTVRLAPVDRSALATAASLDAPTGSVKVSWTRSRIRTSPRATADSTY